MSMLQTQTNYDGLQQEVCIMIFFLNESTKKVFAHEKKQKKARINSVDIATIKSTFAFRRMDVFWDKIRTKGLRALREHSFKFASGRFTGWTEQICGQTDGRADMTSLWCIFFLLENMQKTHKNKISDFLVNECSWQCSHLPMPLVVKLYIFGRILLWLRYFEFCALHINLICVRNLLQSIAREISCIIR